MRGVPSEAEFRAEARSWLAQVAEARPPGSRDGSVAVFDNHTPEEERAATAAGRTWERTCFDAGWGALSWPAALGGRDLPAVYEHFFREEEDGFVVPRRSEVFPVTKQLVARTVAHWGTSEQQERFVRPLLRTDVLACQFFSEPDAGSDLAGVRTRAEPDGDHWVLRGQKIWSSGATVADLGLALCTTDPEAGHAGLVMFLVPLDSVGLTVVPIRQMTGGASFSEVFLDEVRVPDALRIGPVGEGWKVALTTLSAERLDSGGLGREQGLLAVELARRHLGLRPRDRELVAQLWTLLELQRLTTARVAARLAAGTEPGPEASIGKLFATQVMALTSRVAEALLGAELVAGTSEGAAWAEQVLGAPGYRIAGGSDEVQRSIIGERVLGLPREPRPDRHRPPASPPPPRP